MSTDRPPIDLAKLHALAVEQFNTGSTPMWLAALDAHDEIERLRAQVVELQAERLIWKHSFDDAVIVLDELLAQRQAVLDLCARLRRLGWRTVDLIDVQSALLSPKT